MQASEPLTLEGTGTPGSTVTLYDGDEVVASTTVAPDGTWTLTVPPLAAGTHSLVAKQVGADGKELGASAPVDLTVADGQIVVATPAPGAQATAAAAAVVGAATSGLAASEATAIPAGETPPAPAATGEATPAVAVGETPVLPAVTAEATATPVGGVATAAPAGTEETPPSPVVGLVTPIPGAGGAAAGAPINLEGTGAPGSRVQVYEGDRLLGETTVGADGKWKLTLPALAAGAYSLIAKLLDANGKELVASQPLSITIPTPSGAAGGPPVIAPPADDQLMGAAPTELSGTAAPGSSIKLYDGAKLIGEATVDANGNWTVTVEPLAAGEHSLTAIVYSPDGEVQGASKPLIVNVPATQPAAGAGACDSQPSAGRRTGVLWLQRDRL